ncbi:DNA-binding response OmpR family regulator [Pseudomonas sp. BIGb0278]|jgi:DNA-binding response OmpR family regulator|uniref:Transcriptional activator protein CzcR n=1 Tax=Pseudomonas fluorescens TaxID=294 RepID=A0A5E6QES3_PSEFL|nr:MULTISPECIES: response regulator transcription factor [Pseudomonas]AUF96116.1 DNA-binding response regulator [Pseudomonas sp. 02C 26]MBA1196238.1 response regulator transcription factor [Pseudomonas plecoglossicida]MBA1321737.1 response regulator transcription factor [Pseudomonas plecoglossicida]MBO0369791.1 response regulator transcription factor [Pseudomonas putida]MBV4499677.1 response regulator transcription factor [Pseudomonas shirazensis]
MRILVIEDHRDIHDNLVEFLQLRGHEVTGALDGLTGLHLAASNNFDAIILDIMLPGIDGNQICHSLREHSRSQVAIVMLSARDELSDRLTGFKVGADDYIVKPFAMSEVLARVQSVVARRQQRASRKLVVADLQFDLDTLEVTRAGTVLKLKPTSRKLLEVLMQKSPNLVRRSELEETIWGRDAPQGDNLRSNIHILRSIIDKQFDSPLLHTVHGLGYQLCEKY